MQSNPSKIRPFYVSVKLPTYPFPKPTVTLSSYLGQNACLFRGGVGGQFHKNLNDPQNPRYNSFPITPSRTH